MSKSNLTKIIIAFIIILAVSFVAYKFLAKSGKAQDVWFGDIKTPLSISIEDKEALTQFIETSIKNKETQDPQELPPSLKEDNLPRIIFISVSDIKNPAFVSIGTGMGIVRAIEEALSEIYTMPRKNFDLKCIKIDIVISRTVIFF